MYNQAVFYPNKQTINWFLYSESTSSSNCNQVSLSILCLPTTCKWSWRCVRETEACINTPAEAPNGYIYVSIRSDWWYVTSSDLGSNTNVFVGLNTFQIFLYVYKYICICKSLYLSSWKVFATVFKYFQKYLPQVWND